VPAVRKSRERPSEKNATLRPGSTSGGAGRGQTSRENLPLDGQHLSVCCGRSEGSNGEVILVDPKGGGRIEWQTDRIEAKGRRVE